MYGPQVARQLVKAIREEKEVPAEAASPGKGAAAPKAAAAVARTSQPSFFWLKVKSAVFVFVFLGLLGAGAYYVMTRGAENKKLNEDYRIAKRPVDAFVTEYENKLDNDLPAELAILTKTRAELEKATPTFAGHADYAGKVRDLSDRLSFLIFERQLKEAIAKQDKGAAESLIQDMESKGTALQKQWMPLSRLIVSYATFRAKYGSPPDSATEAPDRKVVSELAARDGEFSDEYRKHARGDLEGSFKILYRLAKDVNDAKGLVLQWDRCWRDYASCETSKDPVKIDQLKKEYPKLKMVQDLK